MSGRDTQLQSPESMPPKHASRALLYSDICPPTNVSPDSSRIIRRYCRTRWARGAGDRCMQQIIPGEGAMDRPTPRSLRRHFWSSCRYLPGRANWIEEWAVGELRDGCLDMGASDGRMVGWYASVVRLWCSGGAPSEVWQHVRRTLIIMSFCESGEQKTIHL